MQRERDVANNIFRQSLYGYIQYIRKGAACLLSTPPHLEKRQVRMQEKVLRGHDRNNYIIYEDIPKIISIKIL